jgi:lipid II:glycine glycyltransferase (peptidoglycan interpeptide bridge formation enzyme)
MEVYREIIRKPERETWNELVAALPGAHPLQTWEWGQVKSRYGWEPNQLVWKDSQGCVVGAALVLGRTVSLPGLKDGWRVMYAPRGPLLSDWTRRDLRLRVFEDLAKFGEEQSAIFLKIDPETEIGRGIPGQEGAGENPTGKEIKADLESGGWTYSTEQIQFRNTVTIDLQPEVNVLLARMKQKTRYNIRLAERRGVSVRIGTEADFEALFQMYAETARRDNFAIREKAYYGSVWNTFAEAGMATPLIAEVEGEPVGGLILFYNSNRAWYLYGMSRESHRDKMPNYLLQWEAMLLAKAKGCRTYDLWGAPDEFNDHDRLWGVYRFKEGFGGQVVRFIGAWDRPLKQVLYRVYTGVMPSFLSLLRRRGRTRTQQSMMT